MFAELSPDGLGAIIVLAIGAFFAGVFKVVEMVLKYKADQAAAERGLKKATLLEQNTQATAQNAAALAAKMGEAKSEIMAAVTAAQAPK